MITSGKKFLTFLVIFFCIFMHLLHGTLFFTAASQSILFAFSMADTDRLIYMYTTVFFGTTTARALLIGWHYYLHMTLYLSYVGL